MRNLNHNRPGLKYLDNLRRELGHFAQALPVTNASQGWPTYFQPVVSSSSSYERFAAVFRILERENEANNSVNLGNPSHQLAEAFMAFESAHINDNISGGMTGRDWIDRGVASENQEYRGISTLLLLFTGNGARIPRRT